MRVSLATEFISRHPLIIVSGLNHLLPAAMLPLQLRQALLTVDLLTSSWSWSSARQLMLS